MSQQKSKAYPVAEQIRTIVNEYHNLKAGFGTVAGPEIYRCSRGLPPTFQTWGMGGAPPPPPPKCSDSCTAYCQSLTVLTSVLSLHLPVQGCRTPTEDLVPDLAPQETHLAPKGLRVDPSPGLNLPTITEFGTLNLLPENHQSLVVQKTVLATNVSPGHKSRRCCHTQD